MINHEFQGVFQTKPMIAVKLSRKIQEIILGRTIKQGNTLRKVYIDKTENLCSVTLQELHYAVFKL